MQSQVSGKYVLLSPELFNSVSSDLPIYPIHLMCLCVVGQSEICCLILDLLVLQCSSLVLKATALQSEQESKHIHTPLR